MSTEIITTDAINYDPDNDRYRIEVPENSRASMAIIEALAAVRRCEPIELDPLYDQVDIEALDALFNGSTDTSVRATVEIDGFEVTVRADGIIDITPPIGGG